MTADNADLIERITAHLKAPGNVVQITTYTRSTLYQHKHAGMFRIGSDGSPLVQRGKH